MNLFRALLPTLLCSLIGVSQAFAGTPQFSSLSQGDVDGANRDFGANSSWHSATTPSSLGSIFGFEVGLVGGLTNSPTVNTLANRAQAGSDAGQLPHAGLLGGLTIPGGFTFEALLVPKISQSGYDYNQFGAAIKWTLTDAVVVSPINVALRGFFSKSQLSFAQNVTAQGGGTVSSTITQSGQMLGLQALVSPKFIPILEPYVGVGILSGKGSLSADVANTSLFNSGVSGDTSFSGVQLLAGLEVKLLILALAAEYERSLDTDSYTAKVSFKF